MVMGQGVPISRDPAPRRLTGPEVELLVDTFDRFGPQQLALFELEEDLSHIADAGTLREVAFKLVRSGRRHRPLPPGTAGACVPLSGHAGSRRPAAAIEVTAERRPTPTSSPLAAL